VSRGRVAVSIVSHGHKGMVQALLAELCEGHGGWIEHVIITHNIAEPPLQAPADGWPFRFTELFNDRPAGFGANHNSAFAHCYSEFFCVLNPDVELAGPELWRSLVAEACAPQSGLAYPVLLNPDGSRQDNEREAVTPTALLRRHLLKQPQRGVDWVSAAFWLVPAQIYRRLGGFDERFFMYCEDTDFCLRLRLIGLTLRRVEVAVVHQAMRGSGREVRHLAWHLQSLWRLWTGPVLRRYLAAAAS
jgi:N-acetylglucosaminyl-diphospho-decaprenol L-rhamnosyltransferase